jgi:hypothetical protein
MIARGFAWLEAPRAKNDHRRFRGRRKGEAAKASTQFKTLSERVPRVEETGWTPTTLASYLKDREGLSVVRRFVDLLINEPAAGASIRLIPFSVKEARWIPLALVVLYTALSTQQTHTSGAPFGQTMEWTPSSPPPPPMLCSFPARTETFVSFVDCFVTIYSKPLLIHSANQLLFRDR